MSAYLRRCPEYFGGLSSSISRFRGCALTKASMTLQTLTAMCLVRRVSIPQHPRIRRSCESIVVRLLAQKEKHCSEPKLHNLEAPKRVFRCEGENFIATKHLKLEFQAHEHNESPGLSFKMLPSSFGQRTPRSRKHWTVLMNSVPSNHSKKSTDIVAAMICSVALA